MSTLFKSNWMKSTFEHLQCLTILFKIPMLATLTATSAKRVKQRDFQIMDQQFSRKKSQAKVLTCCLFEVRLQHIIIGLGGYKHLSQVEFGMSRGFRRRKCLLYFRENWLWKKIIRFVTLKCTLKLLKKILFDKENVLSMALKPFWICSLDVDVL